MTYVNKILVDNPLAKMSNNKQKRVIDSQSVRFILVSVIAVGTFCISLTVVNKAKNSVVNTVQNLDWDWTGFGKNQVITTKIKKDDKTTLSKQTYPGKKLWDWLDLSSRLAVPILIAVLGYQVQLRRENEQKDRAKLEREIAKNNLAEEAIQKYLDDMAKLLLDKELAKQLFPHNELKLIIDKKSRKKLLTYDKLESFDNEDYDNSLINVVRVKTITILQRLEDDKKGQNIIIHFLRNSKLYEFIFENADLSEINLSRVNLEKANLQQANLQGANLQNTQLWQSNLQNTRLYNVNLKNAQLWKAYLQNTRLYEANLQQANLEKANLQNAQLWKANLQNTRLYKANLQQANLEKANLQNTILEEANLEGANLEGALIGKVRVEEIEKPTTQEKEEIKKALKVLERVGEYTVEDLEKLNSEEIQEIQEIEQFKSACFWEKAIYIGRWYADKGIAESAEPHNKDYIKRLSEIIKSNEFAKLSEKIKKNQRNKEKHRIKL